ncbi:MAG: hypothetical protein ACXWQQ_14790 [Pseudobdellovibrio sp.]
MPHQKIASIGLHPDVVDYSMYPGLTKEKLWAGLKAQEAGLQQMGFDFTLGLIDLGETAEKTIREILTGKNHAVVLIGAGVRLPPQYLLLFEKVLNLIHECSPQAKICFNTNPADTAESFMRWMKP